MEQRTRAIPPLGGIATYAEASRTGLTVEQNVQLLRRYAYIERRLLEAAVAHLCTTPEWEVKCALALHCWLDAEHATVLRNRVAEMREPPLHLDEAPDRHLAACLDEVTCAEDTLELLGGLYRVIKPALAAAYRRHLEQTNPLADHPTWRHVRLLLVEEEEMIAWGAAAVDALAADPCQAALVDAWVAHVTAYLDAAGGIWGDADPSSTPLPARRARTPYVADVVPRRDARFRRLYHANGSADAVASDPARSPVERTLALMWTRLREMDVPEFMAAIIVQTPGKPWAYYHEMARQLWDEARHAMMGEVAFQSLGIEWTEAPVPVDFSYIGNTAMTPLERHALLYDIEQGLMNRTTGKRAEWETARASGIPLAVTFQDYDWADEVVHAQIGRRWLVAELGDRARVTEVADGARRKERDAYVDDPRLAQADASDWWPAFYARVRQHLAPDLRA